MTIIKVLAAIVLFFAFMRIVVKENVSLGDVWVLVICTILIVFLGCAGIARAGGCEMYETGSPEWSRCVDQIEKEFRVALPPLRHAGKGCWEVVEAFVDNSEDGSNVVVSVILKAVECPPKKEVGK